MIVDDDDDASNRSNEVMMMLMIIRVSSKYVDNVQCEQSQGKK
jgi:hypothetical protein